MRLMAASVRARSASLGSGASSDIGSPMANRRFDMFLIIWSSERWNGQKQTRKDQANTSPYGLASAADARIEFGGVLRPQAGPRIQKNVRQLGLAARFPPIPIIPVHFGDNALQQQSLLCCPERPLLPNDYASRWLPGGLGASSLVFAAPSR